MFGVIYIPHFGLQAALRAEPEKGSRPAALVDPTLAKSNLIQVNESARQRGVAEGMTASQALARCADLVVKMRSPAQELAAGGIVLQTAYSVTPYVEATGPGICTMEVKEGMGLRIADCGLRIESNHGWTSDTVNSIQDTAHQLVRELTGFYLGARIGIAATPALALVAARVASPVTIALNAEEFVATLPIAALEPPVEIREILHRWGIRTAGAFLRLGKDKVAERLGPEALELFECVEGRSVRPLKIISPPEDFAEQMEFENEVETAAPLLFVLQRFVEQLARRLDVLHLAVAELHLRLGLSSGAHYEHHFRIPSPTSDIGTLFRTLQTHLENVRSESTIISVSLAARPSLPETHQFGLFEVTLRNPNQFAETLARLGALCGQDRVGTPVPEGTHQPDAFRMKTPDFNGDNLEAPKPSSARFIHGPALRRYRPSVAARIEFQEDRPAMIRSDVCRGAVVDCRGPFASSGNWWEAPGWSREEWDVQTSDGTLHRICRRRDGCFVEGIYD